MSFLPWFFLLFIYSCRSTAERGWCSDDFRGLNLAKSKDIITELRTKTLLNRNSALRLTSKFKLRTATNTGVNFRKRFFSQGLLTLKWGDSVHFLFSWMGNLIISLIQNITSFFIRKQYKTSIVWCALESLCFCRRKIHVYTQLIVTNIPTSIVVYNN